MEEELEDEDAEGDTVEEQGPIPRPRPTLCASLRSRNAHGHVRRAFFCILCILCENLPEKCRARGLRRTFCASLHKRHAHGHVSTSYVMRECLSGARFVRSCAIEKHMDMSQGPIYANLEEREKSLHCTTAKSIAHRSPHRAEDDKGVW